MAYSDSKGPVATLLEAYTRPLTFSGRSTRTELLYFVIVAGVISSVVSVVVPFALQAYAPVNNSARFIGILQWILFYPMFALTGRRLQDFGCHAAWILAIFAPSLISFVIQGARIDVNQPMSWSVMALLGLSIVSTMLWLGALFWPGNEGANAYGPNPRFDED